MLLGVQVTVDSTCPFVLVEVCETCWKFHGVVTEKNGKHCGSQNWKHDWKKFSTFLLLPSRKTVGPVPKNHKFVMCRHAGKKRGCTYRYHSGRLCKFAHSSDEIEVWKWMLDNDGMKLPYYQLDNYCEITVWAGNNTFSPRCISHTLLQISPHLPVVCCDVKTALKAS